MLSADETTFSAPCRFRAGPIALHLKHYCVDVVTRFDSHSGPCVNEYSPLEFALERIPRNALILGLVGTGRFELPTPRTPSECSTRLSHVPTGREESRTR